ncbi:Fc receptor-like protein 3 [Pyxicephalus adspersus]|uniref:Fc receptor-like protein 3 n=1 Tax=Pyxicephalus adspersus TaxID=30357 RepID=UPI003B58DD49
MVTILHAKKMDSGNYHCWSKYTNGSDALRLDVSDGWANLQAPHYVHEGDNITLRCRHYPGYNVGQTIFYKDNAVIQDWSYVDEYHIKNVQKTGNYRCTKEVLHFGMYHQHSDETFISVRELFLKPELTIIPNPVTAGDHMTLLCDTKLSWHRQRMELQFAFYKEGQNIQRFSSSDQYVVLATELEDSGNYYCKVRAPASIVSKKSEELFIHIQDPIFYIVLKTNLSELVEGDHMTLTCAMVPASYNHTADLKFAFYRDGRNVQRFGFSDQYGVRSVHLEDSGKYSCEVITPSGSVVVRSKEIIVHIQEAFKNPSITVIPDPVTVGDNMILTCDTNLSLLTQRTQVQFAFYRDGQNIQEFSLSNQYGVQFAQLEDSGNYSCEAGASVRLVKKSAAVFIQIKGEKSVDLTFSNIIRLILCGFVLIMIVITLQCGVKKERPSNMKKAHKIQKQVKKHQGLHAKC